MKYYRIYFFPYGVKLVPSKKGGKMTSFLKGFRIYFIVLVAGWGFNAEAQSNAFEQYLREMEQIVTAMEGIHDEASAARAAKLMGASLARMEPILQDMETWDEAQWAYFGLNYSDDFNAVSLRMSNSLMEMVNNPSWMEFFIEHMQNMPTLGPQQ